MAAEALGLERHLSDLVNEAYGLTLDKVKLMWETASHCMPIPRPRTFRPKSVPCGAIMARQAETQTPDELPSRARAIEAIVSGSGVPGAADVAGVDPVTVREWAYRDPEFIAAMNRAKRERSDRLRAEVLAMASEAVATIREMIRSDDVPPAVRLKACS
jgi:hypothetical protein